MSELSDLYQEVILEHNKNPRNFREISNAAQYADGKKSVVRRRRCALVCEFRHFFLI
ncbi:MAG: hypothetical protein WBD27_02690 [Pyrinomonadaceae bacterium]